MYPKNLQFSGFSYSEDTFEIVDETSVANLTEWTGGQNRKHLFLNSNVGIGTNSPVEKLDINGNIKINNTTKFDGQTFQKLVSAENDFIFKSFVNEDSTSDEPHLRLNLRSGNETSTAGGFWIQKSSNGDAEIKNYPLNNDSTQNGDLLLSSRFHNLRLRTNNEERIYIKSDGNVGIEQQTQVKNYM